MQTYLEHREEFGGADRIVLALMAREGDIFTPEFLAALHRATDAMFFLPGVDRTQVFSILTPNVRFIEVVEDREGAIWTFLHSRWRTSSSASARS